VNLDLVKQAQQTFQAGDLARTELLLEQAIGSCPGQPIANPTSIRAKLPTPASCPTPAPHELALGRVRTHGAPRGTPTATSTFPTAPTTALTRLPACCRKAAVERVVSVWGRRGRRARWMDGMRRDGRGSCWPQLRRSWASPAA
jgi:hypothetical protein